MSMRTALLICADDARSRKVIHALESEHDIWHVARQRDAMAWLVRQRPQTLVVDLDMEELDVSLLLDSIREGEGAEKMIVIGLCKTPSRLPASLINRLNRII